MRTIDQPKAEARKAVSARLRTFIAAAVNSAPPRRYRQSNRLKMLTIARINDPSLCDNNRRQLLKPNRLRQLRTV